MIDQPTEEQRQRAEDNLRILGWELGSGPENTWNATRLRPPFETQSSATLTGIVRAVKSAEERLAKTRTDIPTVITGVKASENP